MKGASESERVGTESERGFVEERRRRGVVTASKRTLWGNKRGMYGAVMEGSKG